MSRRAVLVGILALLVLAACGGESSAAMLSGTLQYAKAGGIAGVVNHLTIQPDGSAKVSTRDGKRSFALSASERRRVKTAVAKADLRRINVRRGAPVSDAFGYSIRYRGRQLDFDSSAMPAKVADLVSALDDLVTRHGPR
jgi:hypothetical protein